MSDIKNRRLRTSLNSHPGLMVGSCVPFYFCPRSVMLYLLHRGNREGVTYRGGQAPIIHLVADLRAVVAWANSSALRWGFTLSNAASGYFEDRSDLGRLNEINWNAVRATRWAGNGVSRDLKEGKQAEFLVEERFPWDQIIEIGVYSKTLGDHVTRLVAGQRHRPPIRIQRTWYY